jgi:ribosomal protein S18 acetylase RimI-like enzyme
MRNNTITIDVRRATFDDLTGAAGVLAAAFQDDPVFTWCVPDAARRAAIAPSFFRIVANAIAVRDEIRVAAVSDRPVSGAIDGAALWLPAGAEPVGDLESAFVELLGDDAGRMFEVVGLLQTASLWFVGVAPGAQGRGIGSALLSTGTAGAARVVATSKDSRRLFERNGFEVLDERRVGTSPTLWAMGRDT